MEEFYPIVVSAILWGRSGRVLPYCSVSYTMGREVEGFYPIVVSAILWGEKWKGKKKYFLL